MRRATRSHTGLLVALTLALCATPPGLSRAVVRAGASAVEPSAEVAQAGGAVEEREQGRALLHRGKAGEALVHLERALKSFQQAGDKSGEASTRDLMGELYERQGRYDVALQNYDAAYDWWSASTGLTTNDIVLTLEDRKGKIIDAVFLANDTATTTSSPTSWRAAWQPPSSDRTGLAMSVMAPARRTASTSTGSRSTISERAPWTTSTAFARARSCRARKSAAR